MRKKVGVLLIGAMVVGLIGGCGQKEAAKTTAGTGAAEVIEEAVEQAEETVEEAVEEVEVVEPEEVIEEAVEEEVQEMTITLEDLEAYLGTTITDREVTPMMTENAEFCIMYDGIQSATCEDVLQYVTEDGVLKDEIMGDNNEGFNFYNGYFAYPEYVPNDSFEWVVLNSISDYDERLVICNPYDGRVIDLRFIAGWSTANQAEWMANKEESTGSVRSEVFDNINLQYGPATVWKKTTTFSMNFTEEEGNTEEEGITIIYVDYVFRYGNFTVSLSAGEDDDLTIEEIQDIADHIYIDDLEKALPHVSRSSMATDVGENQEVVDEEPSVEDVTVEVPEDPEVTE